MEPRTEDEEEEEEEEKEEAVEEEEEEGTDPGWWGRGEGNTVAWFLLSLLSRLSPWLAACLNFVKEGYCVG